jgi:hypothetical protein
MPTTYEAIATVTVGSGGAANIEFTAIPATFTDLLVKGSLRTSATPGYAWGDVVVNFNGSSANRSQRGVYGTGSSATSFSNSDLFGRVSNSDSTASTFGSFEMYVPNYAGSTNKSVSIDSVSENNATAALADLIAGLWSNTAAITSIKLTPDLGNFTQYSTATLYGIKNS